MQLPDDLRPSYHDPELWRRLAPRITEHYDESCRIILARKVETMDAYTHQMGYIAALKWVLAEAHHLTRMENRED